jgi:prepilin-type processing-associated H-X9-DG protein
VRDLHPANGINQSNPILVYGRAGLTILECLIVVSTLSLLMSLLIPAIQAAREAARNVQCVNNLHQIGDALHIYHDNHRALPAGWQPEATNKSSYAWSATILRELEQSGLCSQVDHSRSIEMLNEAVRSTTPEVFLCPSDPGEAVFPLYSETGSHGSHSQDSEEVLLTLPRANYVGVFGTTDPDDVPGDSGTGIFVKGRCRRFADITRGLSHVVFVGERTTRKLPSSWLGTVTEGEDAAGRIVGYAYLGPDRDDADECEFDSRHPGHVNFAWADGHVANVDDAIDCLVYRQMARCQ